MTFVLTFCSPGKRPLLWKFMKSVSRVRGKAWEGDGGMSKARVSRVHVINVAQSPYERDWLTLCIYRYFLLVCAC